jgi:hypothetical protein
MYVEKCQQYYFDRVGGKKNWLLVAELGEDSPECGRGRRRRRYGHDHGWAFSPKDFNKVRNSRKLGLIVIWYPAWAWREQVQVEKQSVGK